MDVTLEQLLEVGAHFGHHSRRWNPKMASYLYGVKEGIHIFDLAKTRQNLLAALDILKKRSQEGKVILLVGTKKQAKEKVKEIAKKVGCAYVNERWLGGTLTNFGQISRSVKKLDELREELKSKDVSYTKKERLLIARDIEKLERFVGGLVDLKKIPDLIVIIDTHKEKGAVIEAKRTGVETIGVVDSNADPNDVTYPIPMNDDGEEAVAFVLDLFEKAIMSGKTLKAPLSTKSQASLIIEGKKGIKTPKKSAKK